MEKLLRTDECNEEHGITKDIRRFQEYYDQVSNNFCGAGRKPQKSILHVLESQELEIARDGAQLPGKFVVMSANSISAWA